MQKIVALQSPIDDLHNFVTSCADSLPLIHLIIKESSGKPPDKVLYFLHNVPDLDILSQKVCSLGHKAGERYPYLASKVLFEAAKYDKYNNIVCAMLNAGTQADGNFAPGSQDITPLMHAAMHGSVQNIKSLITHKADVTQQNAQRETSLLVACKNQQWEAAKVIFDYDSHSFCADLTGETPFTVAIKQNCVEFVQKLAAKMPDHFQLLLDTVSLSDACLLGYDMVVKASDIPTQDISSAVNEACIGRQVNILQYLSSKLDDQLLAEHMVKAYTDGHVECMETLLTECQKRPDVPCPNISLSGTCVNKDHINLTYFLAENGQDVNENKGEPLLTAAKHDNIKAARYLIQHGAEVNQVDAEGITPLLHACKVNNLHMVDLLLHWNADLNIGQDETPLTVACRIGNLDIVNRLLHNEVPPDLSRRNKEGLTGLEIAIESQHSVIAMNLMKRDTVLALEHVSLQKLCQLGNTKQVSMFLQRCKSSQCLAAKVANTKLVRFLLRRHKSNQSLVANALDGIVHTDNVPLMKLLVDSDMVSISSDVVLHALKRACVVGSIGIVKLLIDYDKGRFWASVKNDAECHLHFAIEHHHVDIVQFLIKCGCDPAKGLCTFTKPVQSTEILSILLKYELPQSVLNDALIAVCRTGHSSSELCARLLLNKCADVNYRDLADPDQLTPLLAATLKSSTTLVNLLLSRGANPNLADSQQRTPLYIACQLEHHEIASFLLYNEDIKTDPNLPDLQGGKCPVWVACMNGYLDLVCLLLDNNASTDLISDDGQHMLLRAHAAGQYEVVRLLLEHEADPSSLSCVGLHQTCALGYSEVALSVCQDATDSELVECISVSCKSGFSETGLELILSISDCQKQKRCYEIWQQNLKSPLMTSQLSASQSHKNTTVWQCVKNKDMVGLKSLISQGHDPNTKDAQGNPLLHVCIQNNLVHSVFDILNCPSTDVNIKDEQGKTALFYSLAWPLAFVSGKQICLYDYLASKGAEMHADNFGRAMMHEWAAVFGRNELSLDKLTKNISVDCQDHKGQTSLHVAVLKGNADKVKKLLEFGSDPTKKDINALSPFDLAQIHTDMCKWFVKKHPQLENICKCDQLHKAIPVTHAYFDKSFTPEHRAIPKLNKLFQMSYCKSTLDLFRERFETQILISQKATFKKEFLSFQASILDFMTDLSVAIEKDDPLFAFRPILSVSCSEGTKVLAMNEADVLCVFGHVDWHQCDLKLHEGGDYTYMQLKNIKLTKARPELFSENQLSVHSMFKTFYGLVRKHIATVVKAYPCLYVVDHKILYNDRRICPLELAWSGKMLTWQEFSLDVVPAIPVPVSKVPGKLNHHGMIHGLVVVPKWSACLIDKPYADNAFQLGFSSTEKDLFYGMPDALRQGYKVAKVVLHYCMVIDDVPVDESVSSYMLKCQAFERFTEMTGFQELTQRRPRKRDLIGEEMEAPLKVLDWADKILAKLELSFAQLYLMSFFLPGSNLVGHSMYKKDYRPLFYVKLCRAMLYSPSNNIAPWRQLAEVAACQLLKPENLHPEKFLEDIKMLKEMGLHVDFKCENGFCLLYYAINYNLAESVRLLLEWQASVQDVDTRGRSALEVAYEKSGPVIIRLLKEKNAGTDRENRYHF